MAKVQQKVAVERRITKSREDTTQVTTIITAFFSLLMTLAEGISDPTTIAMVMASMKLMVQVVGYVFNIDLIIKKDEVKEDTTGTAFAALAVSCAYEVAQIGSPFLHPAFILIFQSFATEYSKLLFRTMKYKGMRKK
tara:strand:+ start:2504 stop:2914 length:411 start_codon:yes stop_codon:yes gene_type:complete